MPRFLFVVARSTEGEQTQRWRGGQPRGSRDNSWAAWRLLGSNNRELGRSADSFLDEASARQNAAELVDRLDGASPELCADLDAAGWTWRIQWAGRPLVVAARGYARQREALYNAGQFLSHVPFAVASEGVVVLPPAPRELTMTLPRQLDGHRAFARGL